MKIAFVEKKELEKELAGKKVATSASFFTNPKVSRVLDECEVVMTTNISAYTHLKDTHSDIRFFQCSIPLHNLDIENKINFSDLMLIDEENPFKSKSEYAECRPDTTYVLYVEEDGVPCKHCQYHNIGHGDNFCDDIKKAQLGDG